MLQVLPKVGLERSSPEVRHLLETLNGKKRLVSFQLFARLGHSICPHLQRLSLTCFTYLPTLYSIGTIASLWETICLPLGAFQSSSSMTMYAT